MMASSNGNIFALVALCAGNSPETGEFPSQRSVTRSFYDFFDICLNTRLSKQSCGWWFETPLRSLWRHCNVNTRVYLTESRPQWPLSLPAGNWKFPRETHFYVGDVYEILLCVYLFWTHKKSLNTLRPRRNRRNFANDLFKCIFFKWEHID